MQDDLNIRVMTIKDVVMSIYVYGLASSMDMKDSAVSNTVESITRVPYLQRIFKDILSECFTDGYYGEYNNAESYSEKTTTKIYKNLGYLKNLLNISEIMQRIPSEVFKFLEITDTFLVGGGALKVILNESWTNGDWDIFYHTNYDRHIVSLAKKIVSEQIKLGNLAKVAGADSQYGGYLLETSMGLKIQLVPSEHSDPLQIVDRFDINVCKFAINRTIPCIYGTNEAFDDLVNKSISLNRNTTLLKSRDIIKKRASKYIDRGFTCTKQYFNDIERVPMLKIRYSNKSKKFNGADEIADEMPELIQQNDAIVPAINLEPPIFQVQDFPQGGAPVHWNGIPQESGGPSGVAGVADVEYYDDDFDEGIDAEPNNNL